MSDIAVEVSHLWKKFRRGEIHDSLRDLVPALVSRLVGRGAKQTNVGEGEFWALKDVNFQLSRGEIGSGGVVRDAKLHAKAVERVSRKLAELGFRALEPHESALPGAAGNREYFLHAVWEKDE